MNPATEKAVHRQLSHFFSIFYLSEPLPDLSDVKMKLQDELIESKTPEDLTNYLILIFTKLYLMTNRLIDVSYHSVSARFLNFKHVPKEKSDSQLRFFSLLCENFCNGKCKYYDDRYFCELSIQLVLFNNMSSQAIMNLETYCEKLSDWLKEQQISLLTLSIDKKACSCYTYRMSGDCACEMDDYGGFDYLDC